MLEAWRGQKLKAEELEGFDLEKLVGAKCERALKSLFCAGMRVVHRPTRACKATNPL
jgi:hypothetical protein